MDRKKLLIAGGVISFIIFLVFSAFLFVSVGSSLVSEIFDPSEVLEILDPLKYYNSNNAFFDNSTPELMAASIARLNAGVYFSEVIVDDVYLTDDGKYWLVDMHYPEGKDPYVEVIIDAKNLMSKNSDYGEWRSLDEVKATYIAEIQTDGPNMYDGSWIKPKKITINGKEIWKISVDNDKDGNDTIKYVYVDLATGKSKNTLDEFNKAAGTGGWLTLKQVDDVINKGHYQQNYLVNLKQNPFKDALRDLYPE